MKNHKKLKLFTMAIIISLISSLIFTATAIADDATPPPATEEPALPPTEEVIETQQLVVEDIPNPISEIVEQLPEEVIETQQTVVEDIPNPISEIVEQLPEDTSIVVVLNEKVEPLATQAAANAFVIGDPIWCPDGDDPTPGLGKCTATYLNLSSLIDDINDGTITLTDDGTIWIMGGADGSPLTSDISIDGADSVFATSNQFSLTFQGGWDGGVLGNTPGTSNFSVPISITNWVGAVTINKIAIDGQSFVPSSSGLEIQTDGDVSLTDVSSINNDLFGLSVEAGGDIDAENIAASDNGTTGADLLSSGGVTLLGLNNFDNNLLGAGLVVDAAGDIELESISASGNGLGGADLTGGGDVMLSGANTFDGNGNTGLVIDSSGDIDIDVTSLSASGNVGGGADLSSSSSTSLLGSVVVFNDNADEGLLIDSGGDIDLENITANRNAVGADLNLSGSLSITGVNVFNNNDETGLFADAGGDIDAENIAASQNGRVSGYGNGAEFYTLGNFFLTGSNVFNDNHDTGLYVDAVGYIDAESVTASGNIVGSGAEFFTLGGFTLSGTNAFNGNGLDGLFVDAVGEISIEDITARFNGGSGIFIEGDKNAFITCGLLKDNGGYEIEADLPGMLTLNGVDFGGNIDENLGGVDFGGNIDENLGVDEDLLNLVSNGCFQYPARESDGDGDGGDAEAAIILPPPPLLPINVVNADDGQVVKLDCSVYRGTQLVALKGGVYIPCPISDSVRLINMPSSALPGALPDGQVLVSSFYIAITKDGQVYKPFEKPGSIWYIDTSANILEWIDITEQANPFLSIFFTIPDDVKSTDLAVLYWDGSAWVELSDGQYFENGRITQTGGYVNKDGLFEIIVNFVGAFVLVQK